MSVPFRKNLQVQGQLVPGGITDLQPKLAGQEPGAHVLRGADDGGCQPGADAAGLQHGLAVGQADGDAGEEGVSRAGGVLYVHLDSGADAAFPIVGGVYGPLAAHGHHHPGNFRRLDVVGQGLVEAIQKKLYDATGRHVEVMVYGDGAFKDPVGKIWELADPVVSPAYTAGLEGTPNELKLKYLADNDFAALNGEELRQAIKGRIAAKDGSSLVGNMVSEGTTPRRLTDLIGSLCDLTSGSGDKGTPIVYIQGYFDNYTND